MLKDKKIDYVYSSSGTVSTPFHFFNTALSNSIRFDLGLGFFSTASLNVLSVGFANFIVNGGVLRLYINQYMTEEDYNLLTSASQAKVNEQLLTDFNQLRSVLSKRDEHFFNCLSYLISTDRVEIKIVIPKSGGIAHQKFGIFTDEVGDKVSFSGSLNFTASALLSKNIEAISCSTSWDSGNGQISEYERLFDNFFNGKDSDVKVYDAADFKRELVKVYPPKGVTALLEEEKEFIKTIKDNYLPIDTDRIVGPRFPYPSGAFDYQIEAYHNWCKNGYTGIFAMATGTGKTITSLNCVLEEFKKNHVYKVLILVPTIDLVNQWEEEVSLFGYENIYIVNSGTKWRQTLAELKDDFEWGIEKNFIIISTYASFTDITFQKLVNALADDKMILIADEAHNVGATKVKKALKSLKVSKRIALSATPKRAFDEEGTIEIERLFNDKPPYCYSYSMEQAINAGRLMKYLYYPRLVYLDNEEMETYRMYTKMLLKFYDSSSKSFKDCPEVQHLLIQRKRVLHKAQDKYRVFEGVIDELIARDLTKYCFVYAPEGFDPNADQERILENMQSIVNSKYPHIRTNSLVGGDSRRKDKIKSFQCGHIDMLFAMKCLDEGVDVPRTEVGVFTSSTGNPRQFIQRRGRLLRKHPDKTFATIYDLIVVPNFNYNRDPSTFEMERSLVRGELTRVAYFASLASNYHEISDTLSEVADYYELELSVLINDLK